MTIYYSSNRKLVSKDCICWGLAHHFIFSASEVFISFSVFVLFNLEIFKGVSNGLFKNKYLVNIVKNKVLSELVFHFEVWLTEELQK